MSASDLAIVAAVVFAWGTLSARDDRTGILLALALFSGMSIWLALLVAAALAPTDAALGRA